MTRITPLTDDTASEQVRQLWKGVEDLLGRVPNCWRVLAHSPDVATWLLPFCATLHRDGAGGVLDVRIRNLVAMETSITNQCAYCTSHNTSFGKGLGLTEKQISLMEEGTYADSDQFDGREKAAIWWAEEVTRNTAKFNHECFAAVEEHFSEPEIVELTMMAGLFAFFNRINDSLWVDIEEQDEVDLIRRTTHLTKRDVHSYARSAAVEAGE